MTIKDIRELLRDWKALAGLASIISMLGGGGYVGFQHFVQDEVVPIVKEVEEWDTPTPLTTDTALPTEAPTSVRLVSPSTPQATEVPTLPANTMTATPKATQTPLPTSKPKSTMTPTAIPSKAIATAAPVEATARPIQDAAALATSAPRSLPTGIPNPTASLVPPVLATETPSPTAVALPTAVPTATSTPLPTPTALAESTPLPLPTSAPLAWADIEWLRTAPAPAPDGHPDWVYDSRLGTIYGQVSHPDLLLDITMLQVNRGSCNALLYVVGDVGEPKNIPLYGAPLAAWVDKYGAGTEAPYFNLLARLTVAEYDAIVAEVGAPELDPYAETYGTTNLNPAAQREAEACAASANAETMLPSLIHEYINAERAQEGLGALEWHKGILPFAQAHTDDMALHDYFSHKNRNGDAFPARWAAWEHDECSTAGENLSRVSYGVDQDDRPEREPDLTAATMVEGWMGSTAHRAAILTPEFTHTAIAVAYGYSPSREKNEAWATQIFCVRKE